MKCDDEICINDIDPITFDDLETDCVSNKKIDPNCLNCSTIKMLLESDASYLLDFLDKDYDLSKLKSLCGLSDKQLEIIKKIKKNTLINIKIFKKMI